MTSEKLNSYLSDIDNKAKDMFSWLVKELSEKENVTENFKCENQIEWIAQMNNICNGAR